MLIYYSCNYSTQKNDLLYEDEGSILPRIISNRRLD